MDFFDKKKKRDDPFSDFREMEKRIQKMMDEMSKDAEFPGELFDRKRRPLVMSFSLKMNPKGTIRIREFRDNGKKGTAPAEAQKKPLVQVNEEGKKVTITAEMPGAKKEDISASVQGTKVTIQAEGTKKYFREIELNNRVKRKARMNFKNGILELTLEKRRA